jgi:hypothetical protein
MAFDAIFVLNLVPFGPKKRILMKLGPEKNHREKPVLTEDEMAKVREKIDWWRLVLESLRDCRDTESLIFGLQKVWEGVNEILTTAKAFPDTRLEGTIVREERKRRNLHNS